MNLFKIVAEGFGAKSPPSLADYLLAALLILGFGVVSVLALIEIGYLIVGLAPWSLAFLALAAATFGTATHFWYKDKLEREGQKHDVL